MADPQSYINSAQEKMEGAVSHLDDAFAHIRAGKANPRILDPVRVEYYGQVVPVSGVANVNTPDARTIVIQPWERNMLGKIAKAIQDSEVGITPENNGEVIRLGIPPLTEDRRRQLCKQVRAEAENAKVAVRNARRDAIDGLKKEIKNGLAEDAEKDAEDKMQKVHDKFVKMVDELTAAKEKEVMTV